MREGPAIAMGPWQRAVNGRALLTTVLVVARFACAEALCTNATVTIDTGYDWDNHFYPLNFVCSVAFTFTSTAYTQINPGTLGNWETRSTENWL